MNSYNLRSGTVHHLNPIVSEIEDGLLLGDINSANNVDMLDDKHVGHVISCLSDKKYHTTLVHQWSDMLQIDITNIVIRDSEDEDISKYFHMVSSIIDDNMENGIITLVHCMAGISRSASLVIAFIMRSRGIGYDDAFNEVRRLRKCIDPNDGFVRQLRTYEKKLRADGIIETDPL